MKTLTLRTENYSTLENGGPVSFSLTHRGAQIGRRSEMDWVLPDTSRHISGHHFDITFRDDTYFLTDVSSNGTFLHGDRYRIDGLHEIKNGDRFVVGHYLVRAEITLEVAQPAPVPDPSPLPLPSTPAAPPPNQEPTAEVDDWSMAASMSSPSSARTSGVQLPPTFAAKSSPDEEPFTPWPAAPTEPEPSAPPQPTGLPEFVTSHRHEPPQSPSFSENETGATGSSYSPTEQDLNSPALSEAPLAEPRDQFDPWAQAPVASVPDAPIIPAQNPPNPVAITAYPDQHSYGVSDTEGQPPATQVEQAYAPPQQAQHENPVPNQADAVAQEFLNAFLQGAGVYDPLQLRMAPTDLAFILGQCARTGTKELMQLLQDRAAVKLFVSGDDRTMRISSGNNPMKFLPDSEQAFDAMFLNPKDGYMNGADGFANALADIRLHHNAIIAALQPALAEMLEGLSPDEIESTVGTGRMSGGARKSWAEFVKRWEGRAAQGENGMLDAFIAAFSRHYTDAIRKL